MIDNETLAAARRLATVLAAREPSDLMIVAAIAGVQAAFARSVDELAAYFTDGSEWRRRHVLAEFTDLQRCRYQSDGDRARWVHEGPPGHVDRSRIIAEHKHAALAPGETCGTCGFAWWPASATEAAA